MVIGRTAQSLLVFRHAPTLWNKQGLYQGHTNIELSLESIERYSKLKLHSEFQGWDLYASPLKRAQETARLLSSQPIKTVQEAIEINFGDWEGQQISDITLKLPPAPFEFDWRGLDHCPPNGESYREAQIRIKNWLKVFAKDGHNGVLVTHKGIILSMLALAWGWEMDRKRPMKIDYEKAHLFDVYADGSLKLIKLNSDFLE